MFRLFPRTRIPKHDDSKGWKEIARELKRVENHYFKFRDNPYVRNLRAQNLLKKEEKVDNLLHSAASDQELKYLGWKKRQIAKS